MSGVVWAGGVGWVMCVLVQFSNDSVLCMPG